MRKVFLKALVIPLCLTSAIAFTSCNESEVSRTTQAETQSNDSSINNQIPGEAADSNPIEELTQVEGTLPTPFDNHSANTPPEAAPAEITPSEVHQDDNQSDPDDAPRYDRQLILDLGRGVSAKGLTEKAKLKNLKSLTIPLIKLNPSAIELKPEIKKFMSGLTGRSRIYIIGHGDKNSDKISHDLGAYWTVTDLARLISLYAPKLKGASSSVVVSLVVCHAGENGPTSIGARLSKELAKKNIPARVYARLGTVSRAKENQPYHKYVNSHYHVDTSKILIETGIEGQPHAGITEARPYLYSAGALGDLLYRTEPNSFVETDLNADK